MAEQSISNEGPIEVGVRERIVRGNEHFQKYGERIEWVDEDRCKVPSGKHPEHFYLVVFGEDSERCNCADYKGDELGTCKHRVAARISYSKRHFYRVVKRHNSLRGTYEWDLLETRGGVERRVGWFQSIGDAYAAKWVMEEGS